MANALWPETLPGFSLKTSGQFMDTTMRSKVDKGPAKVRRRFTAGVKPIKTEVYMTAEELDTLEDFFENTLAGGSLPFDRAAPRSGTVKTFMFTEPPKWAPESDEVYMVSMSLEQRP